MSVVNSLSGKVGSRLRRLVAPSVPVGSHNAVVIAVAAQKGGVGKTTTAVHLAAGLARFHSRKVLLIDVDPQGHVGTSLSSAGGACASVSLGELLLQKRRDVFEICTTRGQDGLWAVPSDRNLAETESLMAAKIGKELLLDKALRVARTHFDVIVIDCPPNPGALTVNALVAADSVLIPCDLSILSLEGVEAVLETIETVQDTFNPELSVLGLLRTRVDRRNAKLNGEIEAALEERYTSALLETVIGTSTDLSHSQLEGQTVFETRPKGRGAQAYATLAAEIDQHLFGSASLH